MRSRRRASRWVAALCALGVLAVCLAGRVAVGQSELGGYQPYQGDAYGNARSYYPQRRLVGSFSNDVQIRATRGYQLAGQPFYNRGADALLEVPGGWLGRADVGGWRFPQRYGEVSPASRRAFVQYGGFGRRAGSNSTDNVLDVFARRYLLLEATSRTAPVRRAFLAQGAGPMLPASIGSVPFLPSTEGGPLAEEALTLDDFLQAGVDRAHVRARADGWRWFKAGEYRRAMRVFESAVTLDPADFESRVGRLFSYVSVGAMRTSMVLLKQITRRAENPFLLDLHLRDFYGDAAEARQVVVAVQLLAQTGGDVAETRALSAFVLWYVGEQEEAMRTAAIIARNHAETVYAKWLRLMREAVAAREQPAK